MKPGKTLDRQGPSTRPKGPYLRILTVISWLVKSMRHLHAANMAVFWNVHTSAVLISFSGQCFVWFDPEKLQLPDHIVFFERIIRAFPRINQIFRLYLVGM